jgi:hypothetical protein
MSLCAVEELEETYLRWHSVVYMRGEITCDPAAPRSMRQHELQTFHDISKVFTHSTGMNRGIPT